MKFIFFNSSVTKLYTFLSIFIYGFNFFDNFPNVYVFYFFLFKSVFKVNLKHPFILGHYFLKQIFFVITIDIFLILK